MAIQVWQSIWGWIKNNRYDLLIALVIFIVALLPRVIDLGVFLTADEKNWMQRSYEFVRAFKDVRLNDMLQTTHPGVTALWMMGVAITAKMFLVHIPFSFQTLPHFITAAQLPIALATSIGVPAMYLLLRQIFRDRWLSAVAALLIALNPFLIGHSRIAHVDALLASFLFLAVLATIIYAQKNFSNRWLIASALLSAMAILTKAPAIFMIPFFWLVSIAGGPTSPDGYARHSTAGLPAEALAKVGPAISYLKNRLRDFVTWLLIVGILFVVIWPVFLTVPDFKGNVLILERDLSQAASTPHHMSEDYTLNPWHYPAALITRTTPITLVFGLLGFGMTLWTLRRRELSRSELMILGFVVFFVIMMTLGAKKGDRYILPVFLGLDVLAAVGLFGIAKTKKKFAIGLSVAALLYLIGVVWNYHPYAIAYTNPFFPDNLSQERGWGEGLEQVAQWFNTNAPKARVASWYPQELGMYTSANILTIGAHAQPTVEYVVLYRNMFGRAADHPANDYIDEYFKKREPVFTALVHNEPFAWVYKKISYPRSTGELVGTTVQQELTARALPVAGIEIQFATFRGRAQSGTVIVEILGDNRVVHTQRIAVADLVDNEWYRLLLPNPQTETKQWVVRIHAEGTVPGNAPTIRQAADGSLAVRLLYQAGAELATEEHTKLLNR